jgi:hypothetical protein
MVKKVKSLEQKQADSRRVKAMTAAGMLGVATIFGAAACKHPSDPTPDPKLCVCPDKIHGDAPCACDADAGLCDCKQKFYNLGISGIKLEDAAGLTTDLQRQYLIDRLTINIADPSVDEAISRNTTIKIVAGSGAVATGYKTIELGIGAFVLDYATFDGLVTGAMFDMMTIYTTASLMKQFNNAKEAIYLSRGKQLLPQKMI